MFDGPYHEEFTSYRVKILLGNKKIDQKYSKLRWHIIMAIKYFVGGKHIPALVSNKIKDACAQIERFMSGDEYTVGTINDLCGAIVNINDITRDKVKASTLALEIRSRALDCRRSYREAE